MTANLGRVLRLLSLALSVCGAAVVVAGCFAAWANVRVLGVRAGVPGVLFAEGGLCLSVALLVLLGARKWPLACIVGAVFVMAQASTARVEVPRRVLSQLIGAQMSAFPVNRLLDQFHINDLQVADISVRGADLLGPGVGWVSRGGTLLLIGGLLGLPTDPVVGWTYKHTAKTTCRDCGRRWKKTRSVLYCPACAAPLVARDKLPCVHCGRMPVKGDAFCAGCGHHLQEAT